ncbi:MAG: PASTA domain-containing protein [Ignavibacteria bacterium]
MEKQFNNKLIRNILAFIGGLCLFILVFNLVVMPWYVSGHEIKVPKVVGMNEAEAKRILVDNELEPIIGGERYDDRYSQGSIIFQKPYAGDVVKNGRRIFLYTCSSVPLVKVPALRGKFLRDAQLMLDKTELAVGDTHIVQSKSPKNFIIDQQYYEGTEVKKGTKINLTLSAGQNEGLKVPDLLGKTLSEAEKILIDSKLTVGKINYQTSFSLLPNTVIDQYPGKDAVVTEGTGIDIFVTRSISTPEDITGEQ